MEKNSLAITLDLDSQHRDQISFQAPVQLLVVHFPTFPKCSKEPQVIRFWAIPSSGPCIEDNHGPWFGGSSNNTQVRFKKNTMFHCWNEMMGNMFLFHWNLPNGLEYHMNFIRIIYIYIYPRSIGLGFHWIHYHSFGILWGYSLSTYIAQKPWRP